MHTVEMLEQAIARATAAGFVVRQDWLGGATAGACEFKGRKWLFLDLAQSPTEQLNLVLGALAQMPAGSVLHDPIAPKLPHAA
jgi:hypothetical protein